jgi:hypothetical protein
MKSLSAGLSFFGFSVVFAVLLGLAFGGLGTTTAFLSIWVGVAAGVLAYFSTFDPESSTPPSASRWRYSSIPFWFMAGCFTIFAVRSFCWLLYIDGPELRIQSVNNLGDLSLHVTYIKTFANGIPLWPDNPIYVFSRLRYPAGVDLFNGLLSLLHFDLIRGLVWVGLLASIATFYAFYRWGGLFAIAGFLFNGGVAGFEFFQNFEFRDYQGVNTIAWKSIPLSMSVTQRGLLYAIPAALLLLWHWREKFYRSGISAGYASSAGTADPGLILTSSAERGPNDPASSLPNPPNHIPLGRGPLPFWLELGLYGSLPFFHVHTFLALTTVLVVIFVIGLADESKFIASLIREKGIAVLRSLISRSLWAEIFRQMPMTMHLVTLVSAALVPATFFVWLITDHFGAASMLKWAPGWVQQKGDFAHPLGLDQNASGLFGNAKQLFDFWFINFGFFLPLVIALLVALAVRAWRGRTTQPMPRTIRIEIIAPLLAIIPATLIAPLYSRSYSAVIFLVFAALFFAFAFFNARGQRLVIDESLAFTIPAIAIFLFGYLFKTAPWEWDNLKLMAWGYFLILPYLWRDLIAGWRLPVRVGVCIVLFASGFVSLFGGLSTPGFGFANRAELAQVGVAVRSLPVEARFAAFPTYNHPLLLQGRKVVLGYPGHLWTQGFDYHEEEAKLQRLMRGEADWRQAAEALRVRYIFWGREEQTNYPNSRKPWEQVLAKVGTGPWGTIYDLQKKAKP